MKKLLVLICSLAISACSAVPSISVSPKSQFNNIEQIITQIEKTDVLLLSDHTKPGHLNLSSGGANGVERNFIDPAIVKLNNALKNRNLSTYVLNVEDLLFDKDIIENKHDFDLAYANYDKVLKAAVKHNATIISLHFDADIIFPENYKEGSLYIGGVQFILDKRNMSHATQKLTYYLLHDYKILESLNNAGFRTRPGYEETIKYQDNLTLKITGGSIGGGFLLELAAQDQAIRLYNTPEKTAEALTPTLLLLAKAIDDFRRQNRLRNSL
ncbi:hypothetical protein [Colwellia sp. RSH04]|uniref:hypothetical protein n=1 Tax=Colwellia sp. RSH04 TaxID=2305464 RepID=UPI000E5900C4|nr:hypothetical protein [Colwellia sp. RSH04]RHW76486.1 hypothetical protein D1094_09265 [Colwellia sp. RSH04]